MKGAQKKQRRRLDAEERKLAPAVKEFYREHANSLRPRKKAVVRSEAELRKLGGRKDVILIGENRRQTRFIFGGVRDTRLVFTPEDGFWKLEGTPSLEELKRELRMHGRGLWNVPEPEQKPAVGEDKQKEKPDIAFQAVDALLTCSRDWQDFTALSKSEQKKADVHRAMINVQLAILTTLQALKRDVKNEGRKLQVAFELLTDHGWPSRIGKLRDDAVNLALELQRPPSKKELRDRFDPRLPSYQVRPSEFSWLLKAAGLSWLKRGKRDQGLP